MKFWINLAALLRDNRGTVDSSVACLLNHLKNISPLRSMLALKDTAIYEKLILICQRKCARGYKYSQYAISHLARWKTNFRWFLAGNLITWQWGIPRNQDLLDIIQKKIPLPVLNCFQMKHLFGFWPQIAGD